MSGKKLGRNPFEPVKPRPAKETAKTAAPQAAVPQEAISSLAELLFIEIPARAYVLGLKLRLLSS